MDLRLLQREVGQRIGGVHCLSITNWELDRTTPSFGICRRSSVFWVITRVCARLPCRTGSGGSARVGAGRRSDWPKNCMLIQRHYRAGNLARRRHGGLTPFESASCLRRREFAFQKAPDRARICDQRLAGILGSPKSLIEVPGNLPVPDRLDCGTRIEHRGRSVENEALIETRAAPPSRIRLEPSRGIE
jgi:hypothetical protein